jgi:predicted ATPase
VDGPQGEQLVGRDDALARVSHAVVAARQGAGGTLLVGGVAGIGKTALLRAAVSRVTDVDLTWGTCVEGGRAPGYWPWTQALNGLVRSAGVDRARAAAGTDRGLLATIAPALGEPEPAEETDRGRMLLLDATLTWLRALGAERPVVVVLDDLQWVDESSLALLELVVRDPRPAPVCLLAAFRHDEVPRGLQARLAALVAGAAHVHLTALDRRATGLFVEAVAGRRLPEEATDVIFQRTGGHPFFARELALAAAGGVPAEEVPLAVRDAIQRRVASLAPVTQDVLRAGALAGSTVLPDVVAAVTGHPVAAVDAAAVEAVSAGVLHSAGGELRFAHDLFRESIGEAVDADTRPALRLAIARALEARAERGGDVDAAELASHFRAAVSHGGLDRAVAWALRAAETDRASLALSEAATHLRRLRRAVADAGLELGAGQLVDVLLAEADVLARSGRASDARGLVRAARAAADRAGDVGRAAGAALAAAALGSRFATRRDDVIAELESALAAVGDDDAALEARLTAALARELQHSVPEQRARAGPLSERALRRGRATDDPQVLAACLLARHDVLWTPGEAARRAEVAADLLWVV